MGVQFVKAFVYSDSHLVLQIITLGKESHLNFLNRAVDGIEKSASKIKSISSSVTKLSWFVGLSEFPHTEPQQFKCGKM